MSFLCWIQFQIVGVLENYSSYRIIRIMKPDRHISDN